MEPGNQLRKPPPSRRRIIARRLGAVVVVLLVLGGVGTALAFRGSSNADSPPTTTVRQQRQFRVVFPEGFTRAQMAARVGAVAKIAHKESHRNVKLSESAYLAATSGRRLVQGFGTKRYPLEGFLFPDTYDFDRTSTSAQLVTSQTQEFTSNFGKLNLAYARSKNLTPYDVLIIASMIEGEAQVPSERPLVAAVIYNRLRDHMPLGIDATLRYGLHVPPTQSLTESELHNPTPYNTRLHLGLPPTPINNPGLASLEAAAHPVAHSLSPRMQNAAFAAAGLDWEYVLRDVLPEELEAVLREVEYANVTAPHKLDAARILGSDLPSVNTIVRGRGFSTDAAILEQVGEMRAAAVVGDGGAAAAFRHALPDARVFSRRGQWPPDVGGADLVIHATSVRDAVLFELAPGQTLIDLPYPRTATAEAAAAAGARVLDGLEVLAAQGAASFELWTGHPVPVETMRRALGLT